MSIKRRNDDKFIRPTAEDNENFESFSFPMITILAKWKTLFYSKNSRKNALARMVTPKRLDENVRSLKKNGNDSQSDAIGNSNGNKVAPLNNSLSNQSPSMKGNHDNNTKSLSYIDDNNFEDIEIPKEDEEMAKEFLNRFLLNDEGSAHSMINLVLFFKSLPSRIKSNKLKVRIYDIFIYREPNSSTSNYSRKVWLLT